MIQEKPLYFYNLYLVRTRGIKSILYRVLHNSYFDSVAFISDHGSVISIDRNGVILDVITEYRKDKKVISVKKSESFYVEEGIAFQRFLDIVKSRRTKFYDYRTLIQKGINTIGKKLRIKWIENLQIKNENLICSVEFVIKMFGVSNEVCYTDKSIDWFNENDIYDFLDIPK
tara:strand:+ start:666 stop:1181 length:516 start_codon:yes stop_codon:yes gene_type:complete